MATTTLTAKHPATMTLSALNAGAMDIEAAQFLGAPSPQQIIVGLPTADDAAQPLTAEKAAQVGIAAESDTAQPVTAEKTTEVGIAAEDDTALTIGVTSFAFFDGTNFEFVDGADFTFVD